MLSDHSATGNYRIALDAPLAHPERIGRADLAAYLVSCLTDPATHYKKVMISY
jgi:hypothetical protein